LRIDKIMKTAQKVKAPLKVIFLIKYLNSTYFFSFFIGSNLFYLNQPN